MKTDDTLPCFPLQEPVGGIDTVSLLASQAFGFSTFSVAHEGTIDIARETGTSREVEFDRATGAVWMADWADLWNPELVPTLPDVDVACADARAFLDSHHLLPGPTALTGVEVVVGDPVAAKTIRTVAGGSDTRFLDVHVAFPITIRLPDGRVAPIIGRAKWSVTYVSRGTIVNCLAASLTPGGPPDPSDTLPPAPLAEDARDDDAAVRSTVLVYERLRDVEGRQWLLPMYLVTVQSKINPSCTRYPATERSKQILDALVARGHADQDAQPAVDGTLAAIRRRLPSDTPFGATWTLDASEPNAVRSLQTAGLVEHLRGLGWHMESFVEKRALEEHWNARRSQFVDQVELAYFCGHGSPNGWKLTAPADGELGEDDVNRIVGPVRFGRQFLNWIAIAACGPLQDLKITDETDKMTALRKWQPAFDGLLGLCGFATTSVPHPDMGRVFARALASRPVPKAWFRAGRECQGLVHPSGNRDGLGIWMGAMTCDDDDLRTFNQTIDDGRESRTRRPPTRLMMMWTPA